MADKIDYDSKVRKLIGCLNPLDATIDQRDFAEDVLREVATAAARAQREACYDHTLQTLGCLETARVVRNTQLVTESEAKDGD